MGEVKSDEGLKLVATRKEAIAWIRQFLGDGEDDTATWEDIIPWERIKRYAGGDMERELAVKWGVEEGAIAMLIELFDIKEDELK